MKGGGGGSRKSFSLLFIDGYVKSLQDLCADVVSCALPVKQMQNISDSDFKLLVRPPDHVPLPIQHLIMKKYKKYRPT